MAFSLRPRKPKEPRGRHRHRKGGNAPTPRPGLTDPVFVQKAPVPPQLPVPPPVRDFSPPPSTAPPTVPIPAVSEQPSEVVISLDAVEVEVSQGSVILRSKRTGSTITLVGRRGQWAEIARRLGITQDPGEA